VSALVYRNLRTFLGLGLVDDDVDEAWPAGVDDREGLGEHRRERAGIADRPERPDAQAARDRGEVHLRILDPRPDAAVRRAAVQSALVQYRRSPSD